MSNVFVNNLGGNLGENKLVEKLKFKFKTFSTSANVSRKASVKMKFKRMSDPHFRNK